MAITTWHIHIEGQVQGVGFRPFVYLLAQKFELNGWVNNAIDGVHIELNATETVARDFYQQLIENPPRLSKITRHQLSSITFSSYQNFQILHSDWEGYPNLLITPDFGICECCREDIADHQNRRHAYAFTTCTNCGPRYSITEALPYDRERTTMRDFGVCEKCSDEYITPTNRRYFSQTNSCAECGVQMSLFDDHQQLVTNCSTTIIEEVCALWKIGKIVAIKGVGGYLLTCDAAQEKTIMELRKRKVRPDKPFALMYPNIDAVKKDLVVNDLEAQALRSSVFPIVLLSMQKGRCTLNTESIAPHLNKVGVFLPNVPLFALLLDKYQRPIVATSGNKSNEPIVFDDKKAIHELTQIADFVVTNNRRILVSQDDSVIKFSTFKNQKIVVRRSRGLAPTYVNTHLEFLGEKVLATGAMLKSTFTFLHQKNIYISQSLGDLGDFDAEENYKHTVQHFLNLLKEKPEVILTDQHPDYPSTLFGKKVAKEWGITTVAIPHHLAHFGAILGERNLIDAKVPILGVIWDGTGLGTDGQIWGGEFFRYEAYHFIRCCHLDYFDFILGDKMAKEPRIAALSVCQNIEGMESFLKSKFTPTEWQVYTQILSQDNPLKTSSIGRLFDALAALLDVADRQTYEGEAAMKLESLATEYFEKNGLEFSSSYFSEKMNAATVPTQSLLSNIIRDLEKGKAKDFIAAKFHFSLVMLVKVIATHQKIKHIAFSGGVFQNALLVDLLQHHLGGELDLYFHQQLSPNDENISFGQLVIHQINQSIS